MEKLTSPENVMKFLDYFTNVIDTKKQPEEFTPYIKGLKYFCFGRPDTKLSFLCPEEKLSSILNINRFNVYFDLKPEDRNNAVEMLLSCSPLTFEVCRAINVLLADLVKGQNCNLLFVKKLFNHEDFPLVPVELIEKVILLDSSELELFIIKCYSKLMEEQTNFRNCESTKHWILWCSHSPLLYRTFSSIMNQLLCIVKNKNIILGMVQNFVNDVMQTCNTEGRDFIQLYPTNLQPLIGLMNLDTETLSIQQVNHLTNCISDEFFYLKKQNPSQALLLLSHFKTWENRIVFLKERIT